MKAAMRRGARSNYSAQEVPRRPLMNFNTIAEVPTAEPVPGFGLIPGPDSSKGRGSGKSPKHAPPVPAINVSSIKGRGSNLHNYDFCDRYVLYILGGSSPNMRYLYMYQLMYPLPHGFKMQRPSGTCTYTRNNNYPQHRNKLL